MKRLLSLLLVAVLATGCEAAPKPPRPPKPPHRRPNRERRTERTEVLDFYATWCGPCKANGPAIDRLENEGARINRIDIDRDQDTANRYGITSVPTYVVLVNGKEIARTQNPGKLRELLGR